MSRSGRVPSFCAELEALGYVKITPFNGSDLSVDITDSGRKALSKAKQSVDGAVPSGCHMEEYEAPQKVTGRHGSAKSRVPEQNQVSMTADIGLQKKSIREARKIQAAENGSSVGSTLAHVNSSGHEDEQGVHFPMMNGNVSVRVLVTRAALRGEGGVPVEGVYMGRFEAARTFFEILAREKFDPDRPAAKMIITADDLLGGGEYASSDEGRDNSIGNDGSGGHM
jgi:hypothetical protein